MSVAESESFPRINRLSASLISQIAAGEVIERPASVVKELVENSLDAGAARIEIDIEQGGSRLIRVRDNGCGIHPEDMSLALESHATSKLHNADDLAAIRSLGFRGEALSSIASVSRFRLTSRMAEADQGWSLSPAAGPAGPVPAAHGTGTTVEVRDLFQSMPARRKFLRTERTEFLHILEMVKRLALSRFDLDLRLQHNRRRVLHCPPAEQDGERRIRDILGAAFVRDAVPVEAHSDGMRLRGRLGGPGQARNQSDRQYFCLNGRMIRDKRLGHAVRTALDASVPEGRYPSYVLHLDVDPAVVDVNVHPTKQEVRFRRPRDVHDFIYAAVGEALRGGHHEAVQAPLPGIRQARTDATPRSGFPLREMAALYRPEATVPGRDRESGRVFLGRYLLLPVAEGLLILDTVEARRRVTRHRLRRGLAGEGVASRPLLVPVVLDCTERDVQALEQQQSQLARLGLELEAVGPTALRVRAIPAILSQADVRELCRRVLEALHQPDFGMDVLIELLVRHGGTDSPPAESGGAIGTLLRALGEAGLDPCAGPIPGLSRYLSEADLDQWLGRNEP